MYNIYATLGVQGMQQYLHVGLDYDSEEDIQQDEEHDDVETGWTAVITRSSARRRLAERLLAKAHYRCIAG